MSKQIEGFTMNVTTVDKDSGEINKFKVINRDGKLRVVWHARLKAAYQMTNFKNIDLTINPKPRKFI